MKKLLSVLLALSMIVAVFALVACGDKEGDSTTTTAADSAAKTTTKSSLTPPPPVDSGDTYETVALIRSSDDEDGDTTEWKYHTENVYYLNDGGVIDYIRMDEAAGGDGFAKFVEENPNWNTADFDDSAWESDVPQFDSNIGYSGDAHGLFVRCEFELTEEQLKGILDESLILYLNTKYDNTFHVYINGVEVYAHDDSYKYVEGTKGDSVGAGDWHDNGFLVQEIHGEWDLDDYKEGGKTNADILKAGKNVIACSLKDAWGGRLFDTGLYIDQG